MTENTEFALGDQNMIDLRSNRDPKVEGEISQTAATRSKSVNVLKSCETDLRPTDDSDQHGSGGTVAPTLPRPRRGRPARSQGTVGPGARRGEAFEDPDLALASGDPDALAQAERETAEIERVLRHRGRRP